MNATAAFLLAAALLPLVPAIAAKAGGRRYDNNDPRPWLAGQAGWRARANSAQANTFEALPFSLRRCSTRCIPRRPPPRCMC